MKTKKILLTLALLMPTLASANVDQTTIADYKYDADNCQLNANFSLGGHHRYYREYSITEPGKFSIGDANHTTIAESLNLQLPGCQTWEDKKEIETLNKFNEGINKGYFSKDELNSYFKSINYPATINKFDLDKQISSWTIETDNEIEEHNFWGKEITILEDKTEDATCVETETISKEGFGCEACPFGTFEVPTEQQGSGGVYYNTYPYNVYCKVSETDDTTRAPNGVCKIKYENSVSSQKWDFTVEGKTCENTSIKTISESGFGCGACPFGTTKKGTSRYDYETYCKTSESDTSTDDVNRMCEHYKYSEQKITEHNWHFEREIDLSPKTYEGYGAKECPFGTTEHNSPEAGLTYTLCKSYPDGEERDLTDLKNAPQLVVAEESKNGHITKHNWKFEYTPVVAKEEVTKDPNKNKITIKGFEFDGTNMTKFTKTYTAPIKIRTTNSALVKSPDGYEYKTGGITIEDKDGNRTYFMTDGYKFQDFDKNTKKINLSKWGFFVKGQILSFDETKTIIATGGSNSKYEPKPENAYYNTDLRHWIYNQPHATTTDVLYKPIYVNFDGEFNTKGGYISIGDGRTNSLTGITPANFGEPGKSWKVNGNKANDDNRFYIFANNDKLKISNIEFKSRGEVGSNLFDQIDKAIVSIKAFDKTLAASTIYYEEAKEVGSKFEISAPLINSDGKNILNKAGINYQFVVRFFKGDQQFYSFNAPLVIVPSNEYAFKFENTKVSSEVTNAITTCGYIKDIYGNDNKDLRNDVDRITITADSIKLNQLNNTGEARTLLNKSITNKNKLCFDIKSVAPGKVENITLKFPKLTKQRVLLSAKDEVKVSDLEYVFEKPFNKGQFSLAEGQHNLNIGPGQKVNITLGKSISTILFEYENLRVESVNSVHKVTKQTTLGNEISFDLDFKKEKSDENNIAEIKLVNYPTIKYTLDGKKVKYPLKDSSTLTATTEEYGVNVIGSKQSEGKEDQLVKNATYSDLSTSEVRKQIKQKAITFVKNMADGQLNEGVLYVIGDKKISEIESEIKTIVIKNGNLIVDSNRTNNLGVIVMRDSNKDENLGNIYIKPNVSEIKILAYADGSVMSVNNSGEVLKDNNFDRTTTLSNQLTIKGSLFTRNTIAGATAVGGDYKLPGGAKAKTFEEAMIYDLNYLRRGIQGWDKNKNGVVDEGESQFATVIEFNPENQTKAPPLFK